MRVLAEEGVLLALGTVLAVMTGIRTDADHPAVYTRIPFFTGIRVHQQRIFIDDRTRSDINLVDGIAAAGHNVFLF